MASGQSGLIQSTSAVGSGILMLLLLSSVVPPSEASAQTLPTDSSERIAHLESYESGVTTQDELMADGWNVEDPVTGKIGIVGFRRDGAITEFFFGFYESFENAESSTYNLQFQGEGGITIKVGGNLNQVIDDLSDGFGMLLEANGQQGILIPHPAAKTVCTLYFRNMVMERRECSPSESTEGTQFLSYVELDWHGPETGAEAWVRYQKGAPFFAMAGRATGEVIVPTRKGWVYILRQGEKLPNRDDDCTPGRVRIEPINGGGGDIGPVKFSSIEGNGFCVIGINGVVIPVGSQFEVEDTKWLGKNITRGFVVVTPEGLEFRPPGSVPHASTEVETDKALLPIAEPLQDPGPAAKPPSGDNIVGAKIITSVPPTYPELAKKLHVFGAVVIEAVIGKDGSVREAKVVRSVPLLDKAALEAVRQMRYSPATVNGEPVEIPTTITVTFTP